MFKKTRTKLTRRLQKMAGDYLNKSLDPTYKELGVIVGNAMADAVYYLNENNVDPDLTIFEVTDQNVYTLGYLVGFYKGSFDFFHFNYSGRYNQSEEFRKMVQLCWDLLMWSEVWSKHLTDQQQRDMDESSIRATANDIHALTGNIDAIFNNINKD